MEKSKRVETYEVRLYCDECGEEMKEVNPGVVLFSSPLICISLCKSRLFIGMEGSI